MDDAGGLAGWFSRRGAFSPCCLCPSRALFCATLRSLARSGSLVCVSTFPARRFFPGPSRRVASPHSSILSMSVLFSLHIPPGLSAYIIPHSRLRMHIPRRTSYLASLRPHELYLPRPYYVFLSRHLTSVLSALARIHSISLSTQLHLSSFFLSKSCTCSAFFLVLRSLFSFDFFI